VFLQHTLLVLRNEKKIDGKTDRQKERQKQVNVFKKDKHTDRKKDE
jgi:hypothetical protein